MEDLLETGNYQAQTCSFPVQIISPRVPDMMTLSDASVILLLIRAVLEGRGSTYSSGAGGHSRLLI